MTKVTGLKALERRLKAVPDKVKAAAAESMEIGAQEVVDMAKRLVPVEEGKLRKSIGWTWGDAPKGSITLGSYKGNEYGVMRITIYAGDKKSYYARYQEHGTRYHKAQPFFYVSWRTLRKRIKSRIARNINKAIKSL